MNKIKQLINTKMPADSFARNVVTLMTGTTVAQAIPIAISPILTRLYSPSDFGLLALFISLTSICGSIANGRYELAIVLPVKDEEAINITALCVLIAAFFSIVLLAVVLIFHDYIVVKLGNPDLALWLYFVPLAVFLVGLFNALNYFHVRTKKYKDIANATVNKSIATAATQLFLGFAKAGSSGLVLGQMVSYITGNTVLSKNILKEKILLKSVNKTEIKRLAARYADFPKYSMWSILANTLAYNLINVFISYLFGAAILGFYSIGNRVLGAPSSLVGTSFGQVFLQRATEEKNKIGSATNIFLKTAKTLLLIGLPPFILLYFIMEDLFAFVFGPEWRIAGTYAKIMLPLFFVRFFVSPLSTINSVFEQQRISLIWQISLLLSSLTIMAIAIYSHMTITEFLIVFSITSMVLYIIAFIVFYLVSKGKPLMR